MRIVCCLALFACLVLAGCQHSAARHDPSPQWSIAIHGGAGVIQRPTLTPEAESSYRASLDRAVRAGAAQLARGARALDVAESVAMILEDDPLFNAGRGAVFTAEGGNELDASIMNGATLEAGAVAGLTRTRNPIAAARAVMERSGHVMLAGEGAEAFARSVSLPQAEPSYFFTEGRWSALQRQRAGQGLSPLPRPAWAPPLVAPAPPTVGEPSRGTIGVVVRDSAGDMAAATSTGGLTGKRFGRIGDAPIIGAGTYAMNGVCAVSATGAGEYFIRLAVARSICALIQYRGATAQQAADDLIQAQLTSLGATGGVIVLGPSGEVAFSMNTPGMYRAAMVEGAEPQVSIFAGE